MTIRDALHDVRALLCSRSLQPLELVIVEPGIPLALWFQCVSADGNPLIVVVKVVGALGMPFFLAADDATEPSEIKKR
jgi:hypothetical protein